MSIKLNKSNDDFARFSVHEVSKSKGKNSNKELTTDGRRNQRDQKLI